MARWAAVAVVFAALVPAALLPASAQLLPEFLYEFELRVPVEAVTLEIDAPATVTMQFSDRSLDGPAGLVDSPAQVSAIPHYTHFHLQASSPDSVGWVIQPIPALTTFSGETKEISLTVIASATAVNPFLVVNITARTHTDGGVFVNRAELTFFSPGIPGFTLRSGGSLDLDARQIGQAAIIVTNVGLRPRTFEGTVEANPCDLLVAVPNQFSLQARESRRIPFSVQGPEERFWYNSVDCSLLVGVRAVGGPSDPFTTSIGITVNGFHVAPEWVFWFVVILLALIIAGRFVKRRKERIEEELLGKPQKPWTIPVESVHLKHLKQRDERAWYLVRHHLMEEEYRSALLWYRDYKRATRANREKERVILKEEHRYERWQAHWRRKQEAPLLDADRFDDKLQRKLDRKGRRAHRKQVRKWKRLVAKLTAHHEKQMRVATARFAKQKAKAERKGRPLPQRPQVAAPDLPPKPEPVSMHLAEHRWARKSERYRRRMERRQGNLEVRFEKADARRRRIVIRKMQRLARKLDDPDFVGEHPMLAEGSSVPR